MILLFGYKTKPKIEGGFKHKCINCKRATIHSIVRVTKWFTLFFIPIIPFSNKLFVKCNLCGMGGELKEEAKEKIEKLIEKKEISG